MSGGALSPGLSYSEGDTSTKSVLALVQSSSFPGILLKIKREGERARASEHDFPSLTACSNPIFVLTFKLRASQLRRTDIGKRRHAKNVR